MTNMPMALRLPAIDETMSGLLFPAELQLFIKLRLSTSAQGSKYKRNFVIQTPPILLYSTYCSSEMYRYTKESTRICPLSA